MPFKQIKGVFAGDMLAAHKSGCEFVRSTVMVAVQEPRDIAITTHGGYLLDQNLYQAIKGVTAASRVNRQGDRLSGIIRAQTLAPCGFIWRRCMARTRIDLLPEEPQTVTYVRQPEVR